MIKITKLRKQIITQFMCIYLCPLKESVLYLGVCFFHSILCLVCNPSHLPPFPKEDNITRLENSSLYYCMCNKSIPTTVNPSKNDSGEWLYFKKERSQTGKTATVAGNAHPAYLSTCSRYSKRWTCLVLILYHPKCPQDSWLIHF